MTYTQKGEAVTLEMTRDDYENLLLILGMVAGAHLRDGDQQGFWRAIRFANELNRTNPNYTPYVIPAEFQGVR